MNHDRTAVGALLEALEPVVNPIVRALVRQGRPPHAFALLETIGRRTGRRHVVPVGNGLVDSDTFWVVAEHGRRCAYVLNLQDDPRVRVCVDGRWRAGTATVHADDDPLHRRGAIDQANGAIGRIDGAIFRATATSPLSIRIELDPT